MLRRQQLARHSATILLLSAGLGMCLYGAIENQEQVIWLGAMFLLFSALFGALITLDGLFQAQRDSLTNSSAPKKSERTLPICCLCDGGPGNPHSPACRCGGEHWDIHVPDLILKPTK